MLKLPLKKLLKLGLCVLLGAVLSQGRVFGSPIPFAAVLPLVFSPISGAAAAVGALLGGALTLSYEVIPLGASLCASLLSRLRLSMNSPRGQLSASALTSGTYLMTSLALAAFSGGGIGELFRVLLFSVILFATVCVFIKASVILRSARALPPAATAFCLCASVCAFSSFGARGITLGGIICVYAVLFAAVRFGPSVSAGVSMICALGAGLCSPSDFAALAILGIPAVICGFAAYGSPIRASACLLAIVSPAAVVFGCSERSLAVLADCACAAVVFVLTYRYAVKLTLEVFAEDASTSHSFGAERLKTALSGISERLYELSEKTTPQKSISDAVYSKVCLSCDKSEGCPQTSLGELDRIPDTDTAELYRALPYCKKIPEIRRISRETKRRGEYISLEGAFHRTEARLCSDMLCAVEDVIADAERAALRSNTADKLLTQRLARTLKKSGIKSQHCEVFPSGAAEIAMPVSARINEVRIAAAISDITGMDYQKPERGTVGETVILRFTPKTVFAADIGTCQLSASKDVSGDVVETFKCGGFSYVILSDGMGIGSDARAISLMLVSILKELIMAGFSVGTAVSLSSLVLRSAVPDESFATLDLLKVNLQNGAAELYKAGGCKSYLISDGNESQLRAGGYPVGIISPCDLKVHRFYIKDSAVLVMMSDGAQNLSPEHFSGTVSGSRMLPSCEIAALLLGQSEPEKSYQKDDVSVSVVKIERKAG